MLDATHPLYLFCPAKERNKTLPLSFLSRGSVAISCADILISCVRSVGLKQPSHEFLLLLLFLVWFGLFCLPPYSPPPSTITFTHHSFRGTIINKIPCPAVFHSEALHVQACPRRLTYCCMCLRRHGTVIELESFVLYSSLSSKIGSSLLAVRLQISSHRKF